MGLIADIVVNGITYGMLLFVLAAGLTLALGVMKVVNLAHGSIYMVSAYVMINLASYLQQREIFGSMLLAILAALVVSVALGTVIYVLIRTVGSDPMQQTILTFGILFILADLSLWLWGGIPVSTKWSPVFARSYNIFGEVYISPIRGLIVVVGLLVAVFIWWVQRRTLFGFKLRAVVADAGAARSVGIGSARVMFVTFLFGCLLAGISGVLGSSLVGAHPGVDLDVLLFALVIVVIGGGGSVWGALIGSLLVGLIDSSLTVYAPSFALFSLFGTMLLILAVRPKGIGGTSW